MGHLFVAHGDLTNLACDAILIPCDANRNVNAAWEPILPANLPSARYFPDWLVLDGVLNEAGIIELPAVDGRQVWAFVSVDERRETTPEAVVDRMWAAIEYLSARTAPREGRAAPLIGLPLPGTGHGGLDDRRAEVIATLLERHRDAALNSDVALVLLDRRDFAAVQERRVESDWRELSDEMRAHADRLGRLAARNELSLFIGAGMSVPVGLPNWWALLEALAAEAGVAVPTHEPDPFKAAQPIVDALGDRFSDSIRRQLDKRRHGIGHALLANVGSKRLVTTNFDPCMEVALGAPLEVEFRVLTRELAKGGAGWLLKLNGDIEQPDSIVLTEHDLERWPDERRALQGVVQGLLLTSHLLFVGFSLTDADFLELAHAVSKIRRRAPDHLSSLPGTALALTDADRDQAGYTDLHMLSMSSTSAAHGARTLEIFLDRLVWSSATQGALANEYLLDDRYRSGLSPEDRALRALLTELASSASAEAKSSTGWRRVTECLRSLGADDSFPNR